MKALQLINLMHHSESNILTCVGRYCKADFRRFPSKLMVFPSVVSTLILENGNVAI